MVCCSDDDARMKIYSVSTKHYFAFGALVSEELSYKIKGKHLIMRPTSLRSSLIICFFSELFDITELPRVRWVLPDSYLDVKNKDYGGEF